MPIGIIINSSAIIFGGIIGAFTGDRIGDGFREKMTMIFGCCSMGMGISAIVLMENMPAVILALILGTGLGIVIHLGELINKGAMLMQRIIGKFVKTRSTNASQEEMTKVLVTCIVLFCASGTGIYGSIVSGMTGEHSILMAKSILDLPTAIIFACSLGMVVSLVAVPQFIIFLLLFLFAGSILPLTTESMIADFKACGGFLMLATGFRMINLKEFPTADMIPAMIIVMPISALWTTYILPFVS